MSGSGLKVVVAVDGSKHAEYALQYYIDHFYRSDHRVTALYTTPPIFPGFYSNPYSVMSSEIIEACHRDQEAHATKVKATCDEIAKDLTCYTFVHEKDVERPGHGIVHYVKENNCQYVVMGTRGLGNIKRTILGSVSDHVLHHVHVPVTIVKEK